MVVQRRLETIREASKPAEPIETEGRDKGEVPHGQDHHTGIGGRAEPAACTGDGGAREDGKVTGHGFAEAYHGL